MSTRVNYVSAAPEAYQAVLALSEYADTCGLEPSLIELVKIRASQINGCGFCLDMHTRDARAAGETEERLHVLAAWPESTLFSARERAALAWTDALTKLDRHEDVAAAFMAVRPHFADDELVKLAVVIGVINTWNRINVGFHVPQPLDHAAPAA